MLVVLQCDVCTQQEANPNPERQYSFYELVACKGQSERCSKWRDHVAFSSQTYQKQGSNLNNLIITDGPNEQPKRTSTIFIHWLDYCCKKRRVEDMGSSLHICIPCSAIIRFADCPRKTKYLYSVPDGWARPRLFQEPIGSYLKMINQQLCIRNSEEFDAIKFSLESFLVFFFQ